MNPERYYSSRVEESDDLHWQVGKTVNGRPVGRDQIELIGKSIVAALQIAGSDRVVDIGAGNGLITRLVAREAASVIAVERNVDLLDVARQTPGPGNVQYLHGDIRTLDWADAVGGKAYCYEVVQHLSHEESAEFLRRLFAGAKLDALFIGGIPSEPNKWQFYDDDSKLQWYMRALSRGEDPMGTWYHPMFFETVAENLDLVCEIREQPNDLYTHYYRFDCVLHR